MSKKSPQELSLNDLTDLSLPAILSIPPKLLPIITEFNNYRYFLLHGGRGGGKSQSLARLFLFLVEQYKVRAVCGREIQHSIAESVYSLMGDLIRSNQLAYDIYATKLEHRGSKSTINFRGFREQGSHNIQGMEGIDLLWIDEAQAVTKDTLDVLIPTIRKDAARIFFSMNRRMHDDPVFIFCKNRQDALVVHINYDENPFCTEALKVEARECLKRSEKDYAHIWLGEPLEAAENAVLGNKEIESARSVVFSLKAGFGTRVGGVDIARFGDDKCAFVVVEQRGTMQWEEVVTEQWDKKDLSFTTGRILELMLEHRCDEVVIDEDGIGGAPVDFLGVGRGMANVLGYRNLPYNIAVNKSFGNPRTEHIFLVKEMLRKGYLKLSDTDLCWELEHCFRYQYDNYQRRILIGKDNLKKKGIKSPNCADALLYAVSRIENFTYKPHQRTFMRNPAYYKDVDLIAA